MFTLEMTLPLYGLQQLIFHARLRADALGVGGEKLQMQKLETFVHPFSSENQHNTSSLKLLLGWKFVCNFAKL